VRWPGMLVLLAASLGVMAWTLIGLVGDPPTLAWPSRSRRHATELVAVLGNSPIEIQPIPVKVDVACSASDLTCWSELIAAPVTDETESRARSRILHGSRLPARPADASDWLERDDLRRVIRVRLAKPSFRRTWRGLEVAEDPDGKRTEHRDQTLAALAESKVGLDAILESEEGTFHVKDLLQTSLDEFHLGQGEISWTATAYICYLPPQMSWENRYGEQYSFDRLAEELMRRSLTKEACGGVHLVIAMTKLMRLDQGMPILTSAVRGRLASHVRDKVGEAVTTQNNDGSWPLYWSPTDSALRDGEFTRESDATTGVTVTGHLLEWFHFLPEDLKPPTQTVKAGTVWVRSKLQSSSKDTFARDFCPYTHAVVSLGLAASTLTQ